MAPTGRSVSGDSAKVFVHTRANLVGGEHGHAPGSAALAPASPPPPWLPSASAARDFCGGRACRSGRCVVAQNLQGIWLIGFLLASRGVEPSTLLSIIAASGCFVRQGRAGPWTSPGAFSVCPVPELREHPPAFSPSHWAAQNKARTRQLPSAARRGRFPPPPSRRAAAIRLARLSSCRLLSCYSLARWTGCCLQQLGPRALLGWRISPRPPGPAWQAVRLPRRAAGGRWRPFSPRCPLGLAFQLLQLRPASTAGAAAWASSARADCSASWAISPPARRCQLSMS